MWVLQTTLNVVAGETLTFNPVFTIPEGKYTDAAFTLDFGVPLVEGATVQYVRCSACDAVRAMQCASVSCGRWRWQSP